MKRILIISLTGVFLSVTVGCLVFSIWLNSYLKSEVFRKFLSQRTASLIQAEGEYLPFHWNGTSIYSDGFSARGGSEASFAELRADQIRAELNPRGLLQKVWQIDQLDIQRFEIKLKDASSLSGSLEEKRSTEFRPGVKSSWIPDRLDLRKIVIREATLSWGQKGQSEGELRQSQIAASPEGQNWNLTIQRGYFQQTGLPLLKIDQVKLRYQKPDLFITDGQFKVFDSGSLVVNGEVRCEKDSWMNLFLKLSRVSVTPILPEDWRAKLKGDLVGEGKICGSWSQPESMEANGSLNLVGGRLEALPILDQIATFTRTQQFRQIVLQRATADFSWKDSKLAVTSLIAESEGLLRVEGSFMMEKETVDGQFQVGVTPSSLRWLPGAQSKVFTMERDGYLWAPMHLSGPLSHIKEDLSPKLMIAASAEMIEGIMGTAEKKAKDAIDLLSPFLK